VQGAGADQRAADTVVQEIRQAGGQAVPNYDSVENGEAVVATAIKTWGRLDILVNNAGILRDKSFGKLEDSDWDLVQQVGPFGSPFSCFSGKGGRHGITRCAGVFR
jgi:multifunctional beta-oxidation protein